jgi:hypothetical protein
MTDNATSPTKQEQTPKQKPGPKPGISRMADLEKRVERLEEVIAKIAHMSGAERIIREFGLDVFVPGRQDMRKYKD